MQLVRIILSGAGCMLFFVFPYVNRPTKVSRAAHSFGVRGTP